MFRFSPSAAVTLVALSMTLSAPASANDDVFAPSTLRLQRLVPDNDLHALVRQRADFFTFMQQLGEPVRDTPPVRCPDRADVHSVPKRCKGFIWPTASGRHVEALFDIDNGRVWMTRTASRSH